MLGVKKIYQVLKVDLEDSYDSRRFKKEFFPKCFLQKKNFFIMLLTSIHKIIIFLKVQLLGYKRFYLKNVTFGICEALNDF